MKREKWAQADDLLRREREIRDSVSDPGSRFAHYMDGRVEGAENILRMLRGAA